MRTVSSWILFSLLFCWIACGGGTPSILPTPALVGVTISPTSANVHTGGVQQFAATVTSASNAAVEWRVNGIIGGNDTVGTVSTSGLYSAPSCAVPDPAVVHVSAVSEADSSKTATAEVSLALTVSNSQPEFLYILNASSAQIIVLKIDPATGCINQPATSQGFQLDDVYLTGPYSSPSDPFFSAVSSVDGRFLFVLFDGFDDYKGHVSVPGLVKVFTIDKTSGLPQEIVGSELTLPGVGKILRANPVANFLYVKSEFPSAMLVLQYDADTGALTLRSVDRRTDSSAITDFVISSTGDDLSAVEQMGTPVGGTDFSLRHFALNAGTGVLTPGASQGIPLEPIYQPTSFTISTSTTNLFAEASPHNLSSGSSESDLLVFHADNATSAFGSPNIISLGSYNSDAREGTSAGGLLVSADGRNLFYIYRTNTVNFTPSTGLVFTNECGLGQFSIDLGTNVPSSQSLIGFGDCVIDSSLLTPEGNNFYLKSGPKIVGASIAADGTLKVIGSATQPLLEFPQDPGGSFIASVIPK